jgi:hypothetical protein
MRNYSRNYSPDYLSAWSLKYKMMTLHIWAMIIYCLIFISVILVNRIIFSDGVSNIIKMMIANYADCIGFILFATIYYPKVLPNYFTAFNDSLSSLSDVKFNIFSLKIFENIYKGGLEDYSKKLSDDKLTKKELKIVEDNKNIPIIIINPLFENEIMMNNINVGLRN